MGAAVSEFFACKVESGADGVDPRVKAFFFLNLSLCSIRVSLNF